jgi:hypothetical protein
MLRYHTFGKFRAQRSRGFRKLLPFPVTATVWQNTLLWGTEWRPTTCSCKFSSGGKKPRYHQPPCFLVLLRGSACRLDDPTAAGSHRVLKEENRILREKLGGQRILLDDAQKRRLAMAGAKLARQLLAQAATLFSPETILRWHRLLIARKYTSRGRRSPAPSKANSIRDLVLRMAQENPEWGYGHIHGELKGLGYEISWQTMRRIMREYGLLDEPDKCLGQHSSNLISKV